MTKAPVIVKLQSASLDDKGNEIVAHGWLDIDAIQNLRTGDYQREILEMKGGKKGSIRKALDLNSRLPDIMLGMRGEKYTSSGKSMLLEDDVYIVDGLQRVSALRKYAEDYPDKAKDMRIGAEVRFNTSRESEKELFTILNVHRKSMAPSVILRNERNISQSVATLYGLSNHDKEFALLNKVCWNQQMQRGELMTAIALGKVAVTLHRHTAFGGRHVMASGNLPRVMDNMAKGAGLQNFRANLITFFDLLDEIWGVRGIKYTDRATQTRANFLMQFAGLLSDHEDFWEGNRLVVNGSFRSKLKTFPITDPTIIRLAGAGTTVGVLLYRHLVDHLNKGKQTSKYLTMRRMRENSNPTQFKPMRYK